MYCERICKESAESKGISIMLLGGAHTGACYKITPDGRPGSAYKFAEAGYEVILMDWPGTGRSGYVNPAELTGEFIVNTIAELLKTIGTKVILFTHSMSGPYGWMLLEKAREYIKAAYCSFSHSNGKYSISS